MANSGAAAKPPQGAGPAPDSSPQTPVTWSDEVCSPHARFALPAPPIAGGPAATVGEQPQQPQPQLLFNALPAAAIDRCLECLSPRELALSSVTCRLWREHVSHQPWHAFWDRLWAGGGPAASAGAPPPPPLLPGSTAGRAEYASWQAAYGAKQELSRCWWGRAQQDRLFGHSQGVRATAVLPSLGLVFTGSLDRTVRAWDLGSGVCLGVSRRAGGTVRCLAADAGALASGSSDHLVRLWRCGGDAAGAGGGGGGGGRAALDVAGAPALLRGHSGPVTSVQLTDAAVISGSWDCSVRLWDRRTLECAALLRSGGFVASLAVGGGCLAAAAGREVLLWDVGRGGGAALGALGAPAAGGGGGGGASGRAGSLAAHAPVTAVALAADGRRAFLGTADGGVWAADLRCPPTAAGAQLQLLLQQAGGVTALAFEHPCLAVATQLGQAVLLDAGAAAPLRSGGGGAAGAACSAVGRDAMRHRLLLAAQPGAALCVSLADCWLAVGFECGATSVFDFSGALQHQRAAAAARLAKQGGREQRRARNRQQQAAEPAGRPRAPRPRGGAGGAACEPAPAVAAERPAQASWSGGGASIGPQDSGSAPSGVSSQPVSPAAPASPVGAQGQPPGSSAVHPAPRSRVPAPVFLAPAPAAGDARCRQQAWQVLRPPGAPASPPQRAAA